MTDIDRDAALGVLTIERLLPASVDDVYAAWTDPVVMSTWLSPTGWAEVEADVRVGGRLHVVMRGDGIIIEHTGTYLVVEPPHRLVFTWISEYTGGAPSTVTVLLSPRGNATHLTVSHRELPSDAVVSHRDGWGAMLEHLESTLGSERRDGDLNRCGGAAGGH
jgi:uncharacterized protein YndB with AHSA1/START domain